MENVYYFIVHDGQTDLIGQEHLHWDVSFGDYPSIKALYKAKNRGRQRVYMNEIYTPQRLIKCFTKDGITRILREIKKNRPDLVRKAEKMRDEREGGTKQDV